MVAVLLLAGGLLEEVVAARAGRALNDLETPLPEMVTVRRDGREVVVALADVCAGGLEIVADRGGEETTLGQIRRLVASATDRGPERGVSWPGSM